MSNATNAAAQRSLAGIIAVLSAVTSALVLFGISCSVERKHLRDTRRHLGAVFIGLASHRLVQGDDNVSLQLATAVEKAEQAAQIIERMNPKMLEMESKMATWAAARAAEARALKKQLAAQATELGQLKATGREIRRTEAVDCDAVVEGIKDPHLSFARGGRADFRGRSGCDRRVINPSPRCPHARRVMCCLPHAG